MSAKNQDNDIPIAETYINGSVNYPGFKDQDDLPIFWGPGQKTKYPKYKSPKGWREWELLSIPRTVRFIYAVKAKYDSKKYNDSSTSPGNPVEPKKCDNYSYTITGYYGYVLGPTRFKKINGQIIDTIYEYYKVVHFPANEAYGTPESYSNFGYDFNIDPGLGITLHVKDRSTNTDVYSGTVALAYPAYIDRFGSRTITWFLECSDGTKSVVDSITTQVLGDNISIPPRCKAPKLRRNQDTGALEIVPGEYYSEVPPAAREFYGCSDA